MNAKIVRLVSIVFFFIMLGVTVLGCLISWLVYNYLQDTRGVNDLGAVAILVGFAAIFAATVVVPWVYMYSTVIESLIHHEHNDSTVRFINISP